MEERELDVFERALLFLGNATCENAGVSAIGLEASDRKEGEPCFRLREAPLVRLPAKQKKSPPLQSDYKSGEPERMCQ